MELQRLKEIAARAQQLQDQGKFIIGDDLPLPKFPVTHSAAHPRTRHWYAKKAVGWEGYFDYDNSFYQIMVLDQYNSDPVPDNLLPQPRIKAAEAMFHAGFVTITNEDGSFEFDYPTPEEFETHVIHSLNKALREETIPVIVWKADIDKTDVVPVCRVYNSSVSVYASSLIWDINEQQLVAAMIVTTENTSLQAIKATLAKRSGKDMIGLKTPESSAWVYPAKRGYRSIGNNLSAAQAEGMVTVLLHPLTGDPEANAEEYFYVVVAPHEDGEQMFTDRLDKSIHWPVKREWARFLLQAGAGEGLIKKLEAFGDDFKGGIRVSKNNAGWQEVISKGIHHGHINL